MGQTPRRWCSTHESMAIIKNLLSTITLRGMFYAVGGLLLWIGLSLLTGTLCWFQSILGVPCPGCGSMRAVQALVQRQFIEAHISHPLILLSLALCLYFVIKYLFFRNRQIYKAEKHILIGITILYMGVFIARMIFLFPHTEPLIPLETALWRLAIGFISNIAIP